MPILPRAPHGLQHLGRLRGIGHLLKPRSLFTIGAGALAAGVAIQSWRPYSSLTAMSSPGYLRIRPGWMYRSISILKSDCDSKMASLTPPQQPISWTHTPTEVVSITKDLIEKNRKLLDKIAALPHKDCNFESVFLPLANDDGEFTKIYEPLIFYQNVAESKELRDASNEAEALARDYSVEASMRLDIYQAKLAAQKNIKESGQKLSPEETRLVEKMVLDSTRDGLGLPEDKRKELMQLQKDVSQLCLEFGKNFNEENGYITFNSEDLKGVPADVVSGYTKRTEGSQEVYDVTFKTPDIFPVFKYAENPETRRRANEGYDERLAVNVPLLSKILDIRRQIAKLLGYATYADFVTEVKMVKTAKGVKDFLSDLEQKLKPMGHKDKQTLLAMKKEEHDTNGLPFDGELNNWDYRYYDRKYVETSLSLDASLVKEYFPVSVVVPEILEIYQNLLSIKFVELKGDKWHPDVQSFSVWKKDATDESGFIGYCYLDLYPRAGKYSHAAVWPIIPGYDLPDGKRNFPTVAMVANLAKPTPERPALMPHDDVVTFFHEFGHSVHGLLSKTKFAKFHGTSVARDFVEAPSQMLENWGWEPKVLQKISKHYKTGEPLSSELIDKIIKSRFVNSGLFYLRQLFFASFDIKVHTDQESADYTELWNEMRENISLTKTGKRTPGQGTFAHITGGYDAGYYGYMYSLVFAADMYATVFKKDPLDPSLGERYRRSILQPGGSRDDLDSLTEFLGRPPNSEAFMKELFGSQ